MKILIVGGGIGGCTLAYFLKQYGFEPVIVEVAPRFERLGYLLSLRDTGLAVAEKMGVLEELKKHEITFSKTIWNDIHGKRIKQFNTQKALIEFSGLILNRADLHLSLFDAVKNDIDFRFATEPTKIDEDEHGVFVTFNNKKKERFDIVIGADGFKSQVRELVFGTGFEKFLNASFFAFIVPNRTKIPITKRHETISVRGPEFFISYGNFSQDESEIGGYVIYKTNKFRECRPPERRAYLLTHYGKYDRAFKHILETMQKDDFIYHGDLSQIMMPTWSKGRVCLLGDASYCLTLASGMGASMAMAGAYILAHALRDTGDYTKAFSFYERKLREDIQRLQKFGQEMARFIIGEIIIPYGLMNTVLRITPEFFITHYLLRHSTKEIVLD